MALHAKAAANDPASVPGRAKQFAFSLSHILLKIEDLIQQIQGDLLSYVTLVQLAEQIKNSRNHLAGANGVGHGNLKSADVRQYLALYDSASYASAAEVSTLLQALDAALIAMNVEYRPLIAGREAQPQGAIVSDSGTEFITDPPFTSVETAGLLTAAQAAQALIDKRTVVGGVFQ